MATVPLVRMVKLLILQERNVLLPHNAEQIKSWETEIIAINAEAVLLHRFQTLIGMTAVTQRFQSVNAMKGTQKTDTAVCHAIMVKFHIHGRKKMQMIKVRN